LFDRLSRETTVNTAVNDREAEPPEGTADVTTQDRTDESQASRLGSDGIPGAPWRSAGDPVDPPVKVAWREGTLTRAKELESLAAWSIRSDADLATDEREAMGALRTALRQHLAAARTAATAKHPRREGSRLERAMSNLDAAEADMLQLANAEYALGQIPNILNHVQRHLRPGDPRRTEVEWLAERVGPDRSKDPSGTTPEQQEERQELRKREVNQHRHALVSAYRGASSVALREQTRVRSFRNVIVLTTAGMAIVAIALILIGALRPTAIPLCFAPEDGGDFKVVCPTQQSAEMPVDPSPPVADADIDAAIDDTVSRFDIALVVIVGLTAASIAAAAAIRGIRGSSEPYGVPMALAVLKLPTGAVTAVLGLLLMRGQFVPGLSALDTSAQIVAWAAIFGYAQQLFTRLVDQQAHAVLDGVRGGDKSKEPAPSA
jgi:hypothetical protein